MLYKLYMILKSDRGSALVMVLLMLVVASITGIAILTIGVNEDIQVSAEEKTIQAHYIARAGADSMAKYIMEYPNLIASGNPIEDSSGNDMVTMGAFLSKLEEGASEPISFAGGTAEVTVSSSGSEIKVSSVGNLGSFQGTQSIVLAYDSAFDHLIWTEQDLDPSTLEVHNLDSGGGAVSLASNGQVDPESIHRDSTATATYEDEVNETYLEPYTPEGVTQQTGTTEIRNREVLRIDHNTAELFDNRGDSVSVVNAEVVNLEKNGIDLTYGEKYKYLNSSDLADKLSDLGVSSSDLVEADSYYIERLEINNGGELNVDCTSNDVYLIVDSMNFNGDIQITGNNTLNIYVLGDSSYSIDFDVQTPLSAGSGHPDQLSVYLSPNTKMEFQAGSALVGYVYGPNAEVEFRSSNVVFTGALIADVFVNSSHPTLNYMSPNSAFNIDLNMDIIRYED